MLLQNLKLLLCAIAKERYNFHAIMTKAKALIKMQIRNEHLTL